MGFEVKKPNWSMTTIDLYTVLSENETTMRLVLNYAEFVQNVPLLSDSRHLRDAAYEMLTRKIAFEWMRRKNYRPEEGTLVSDEKVWDSVRNHHMRSLHLVREIHELTVEIRLTEDDGRDYLEFNLTVLEGQGCYMSSARRLGVRENTDIDV